MASGVLGEARALRTATGYMQTVIREFEEAYRRVRGQSLPERVVVHYRDVVSRGPTMSLSSIVRGYGLTALLTPNQRTQMRVYETRLIDAMTGLTARIAAAERLVRNPPTGTSRSDLETLRDAAGPAAQANINAQNLYYAYSNSETYWSAVPYVNLENSFESAGISPFAAGLPAGWAPNADGKGGEPPPRSDPNSLLIIGAGAAVGILGIGIWKRIKGRR
jgi:hypothetical protein